jgi:RNA polymerase sigma-70 factor (ECF subfamily)
MRKPLSDEEVVALVQNGDEEAFAQLMDRYTDKLLRYGKRFFSEDYMVGDTVQDIFVQVYKNIQDFDTTKRFSPWIYRIAHNSFVDVIRKRSKEPLYGFEFDTFVPHFSHEFPPVEAKEREEIRVLLDKELKELAPKYKEILYLYYFEELSYREISDIIRVPVSTVGVRLARARKALKKNMVKKNDYE